MPNLARTPPPTTEVTTAATAEAGSTVTAGTGDTHNPEKMSAEEAECILGATNLLDNLVDYLTRGGISLAEAVVNKYSDLQRKYGQEPVHSLINRLSVSEEYASLRKRWAAHIQDAAMQKGDTTMEHLAIPSLKLIPASNIH